DYREAIALAPAAWAVRVDLATLYQELGKRAEEAEVLHEALRLMPEEPGVHYAVGSAQWRYHNYADAVRAWGESVRCDPDFVPSHERLALALHQLGDGPRALEHLEIVRRLEPDVATAIEEQMRGR